MRELDFPASTSTASTTRSSKCSTSIPGSIRIEVNAGHSPITQTRLNREVAAANVGQSLSVFVGIANEKSYDLVCYSGNAFFVRRDANKQALAVLTSAEAYANFLGSLSAREREWLYLVNTGDVEAFPQIRQPFPDPDQPVPGADPGGAAENRRGGQTNPESFQASLSLEPCVRRRLPVIGPASRRPAADRPGTSRHRTASFRAVGELRHRSPVAARQLHDDVQRGEAHVVGEMRAHAEPDLGAVGELPVQRDEALDVQRIGEHQAPSTLQRADPNASPFHVHQLLPE